MYFKRRPTTPVVAGQPVTLRFDPEPGEVSRNANVHWAFRIVNDETQRRIAVDAPGHEHFRQKIHPGMPIEHVVVFPETGQYSIHAGPVGETVDEKELDDLPFLDSISVEGDPPVLQVALVAEPPADSGQRDLWAFIKDVANRMRFRNFVEFAEDDRADEDSVYLGQGPAYGSLTYERLHELSREFVTTTALGGQPTRPRPAVPFTGDPDDAARLSYVHEIRRMEDLAKPYPYGIVDARYPLDRVPFVELIFVYWIEEAMVFQTLNHVVARFQNRRVGGGYDPLARLSVNPLQPLRGILWGLADAEQDRLSVRRRCAEYEYQYGLRLIGRAIPPAETLVERRTQFLEAFHSLLHASYRFYKERDDKTIDADAFPLLSSLRELHLVLAVGAHNQFADLPLIARNEIIDVQWMLAQPEMREFLGGPTMVPYEEPWMDRVDTMKTMQGWSDVSVTQFYDLAFHGEQLLLSVRHGRWNDSLRDEQDADNWATTWRNSVQRYLHAYRAVTGVDLAQRVDTTMPSVLLARRLAKKMARF